MSEIMEKINCYAGLIINFTREAWQRPYTKELLLGILILLILLIVIRTTRKHFAPIRLFNNSAGVVTVTRKALNELVQSVCYSMGALNRPSVKVYAKRGRLCLIISLRLEMGQNLSTISMEIQEEMIKALREHLGVEKLGSVDVRVKGFNGILHKPALRKPSENLLDTPAEPVEEENNPFAHTKSE